MKIFYEKVDEFSIHKIISIDETSIHAEMTAPYSRCELGRRCVKKTTDNKVFKKFTLVSAISSKGVVGWILYENGGMTSERMVQFINKFIKGKFKTYLVVMDNGGAHKSNLVKKPSRIQIIHCYIVFHTDQKLMLLKVGSINLNIIFNYKKEVFLMEI